MVGPPFVVVVLEERAVRGVGAPIRDFFGVSRTCLLLPPKVEELDFVTVVGGFVRRPAVTNGCLMAVCGFIRRSGSHTRHFATKSTNSSSLHRRT